MPKKRMELQFKERGVDETTRKINKLDRSTQSIVKTTWRLAKAYVGIQAIRMASHWVQEAASAERTRVALVSLLGSTQEANKWIQAIQKSTNNTISELDAAAAAARLFSMGLAGNAKEAADLAEIAVKLGASFGKEATPAIEEFTLLLANQSILRLDTFGLSGARVRTRIKELQAVTPGLTRETAFLTAVMEQGAIKLEALKDILKGTASDMDRTSSSFKDLGQSIFALLEATGIVTGLTWALSGLAKGVKGVTDDILLLFGRAREEIEGLGIAAAGLSDNLTSVKASMISDQEINMLEMMNRMLQDDGVITAQEQLTIIRAKQVDLAALYADRIAKGQKPLIDQAKATKESLKLDNERLRIEGEIGRLQRERMQDTIKAAFLQQTTARQAMLAVLKAEMAEAIAGYISSVLKSTPYPINLVLAAGGSAIVGSLFERLVPKFQHGGSFIVPGSGGPDSQIVQFRATPKEQVIIKTEKQAASAPSNIYNIYLTAPIPEDWARNELLPLLARVGG